MTISHFSLPESAIVRIEGEYENALLTFGLLEVDFHRKFGTPDFLPNRVKKEGKVLWAWSTIKNDLPRGSLAFLIQVDDALVITGVTRQELLFVTPLSDLETSHQVRGADGSARRIGGPSLNQTVLLKEGLAEFFGINPKFSKIEERVYQVILAKRQLAEAEQREAYLEKKRDQQTQQQAERQAKAMARQQRRAVILARQQLSAFAEDGSLRRGYPVVEDEWQVLEHGTYCIQVASYDVDTGASGALIEAFVVEKKGSGRVFKRSARPVFLHKITAANLQAIEEIMVEQDGEFYEVPVYQRFEDLETLRQQGVNGSALAAVRPMPEQPVNVYTLSNKQGIKPAQGVVIHQ